VGVELLSRIREAARGLPALLGVKARAVIVFGSAARPEDFVPGLSDVDVLIISEGEPKRRRYCLELLGHRFEVSVLKLEEVLKAFEEGDPLAHMLSRGIFAYDDGVSRLLPRSARVTARTAAALRRSAVVALGLAVESYFAGDLRKSASHLYHSLRHLVRHLSAARGAPLPISDSEVLAASPEDLRGLVSALIEMRRGQLSREEVREAIEEAIEALCRHLALEPTPLSRLEALAGTPELVVACEEGGHLTFRAELYTGEGFRRVRVRGGEVEEVDSILC